MPEILAHVFSYLDTPLNTGTDPTQPLDFVKVDSIKFSIAKPKLHSCALVNKLWNACVTKTLWKNIKIGSERACERFSITFDAQWQRLASAKKHVRIKGFLFILEICAPK
jgi:hypothetical protein